MFFWSRAATEFGRGLPVWSFPWRTDPLVEHVALDEECRDHALRVGQRIRTLRTIGTVGDGTLFPARMSGSRCRGTRYLV